MTKDFGPLVVPPPQRAKTTDQLKRVINSKNTTRAPATQALRIRNKIIRAAIAFIMRERDCEGWVVITHRGHAWLQGSRQEAIKDKRWLDQQWRVRK